MKLPSQAKLYIAFESDSLLTPEEHMEYQELVQHQFSQYFADAVFDTSSNNMSGQQWLQRTNSKQFADYLIVVRLVNASSGNLIRPYKCGEEKPEFEAKAKEFLGSNPPPAFGPDLSSNTGVEVDEEAQDIESLLDGMSVTAPTAPKPQAGASENRDQQQAVKKMNPDLIPATDITLPEPETEIAYGRLPLAEKKLPADKNELTCEIHFGHGRDQIKLVTWLYNRPYGQLIDHREFDVSAGILGWQTQATPQLFKASIHRLAAQYAGKHD